MSARWRDRSLADLLGAFGLDARAEVPLTTDGWSGASFASLRDAGGRGFVLKRTSLARDWIARWTRDAGLREGWVAASTGAGGPPGDVAPYLGAARDDGADGAEGVAILMPDLSGELIAWDRPGSDAVIDRPALDGVLGAVARLHRSTWAADAGPSWDSAQWCPLPERLTLLGPRAAATYAADDNPVGERFLAGWAAFERASPPAARDLVARLDADVSPLVDALGGLPAVGLHGDLKLANVALGADGGVRCIDWQMTLVAPAAVELGWFLVSNSHSLPVGPADVMDTYLRLADAPDPDAQRDLTWVVGLLLRGWRKGLDAGAGLTLPSGIAATDDLAWWAEHAVAAADRRL